MVHMLNPPSEEVRNEEAFPKKAKYRAPAAEILPSDRFPFSVHLDVLKRFAILSHNGTLALDASRVEGGGIPTQAASLNVRFLKSIALLTTTDRGQYLPTPEGLRFVTARSVSDDRASPILASLLEGTWIASTARSVLSPVKTTKDEVLLGELAIVAQTDKEKKESALRVLVDYLLFAGIVRRVGDGLILATPQPENSQQSDVSGRGIVGASTLPSTGSMPDQPVKGWHVIQTEDFSLRIKSNAEAVDDLSEHLKTLRRKIERLQSKEQNLAETATPSGSN